MLYGVSVAYYIVCSLQWSSVKRKYTFLVQMDRPLLIFWKASDPITFGIFGLNLTFYVARFCFAQFSRQSYEVYIHCTLCRQEGTNTAKQQQ